MKTDTQSALNLNSDAVEFEWLIEPEDEEAQPVLILGVIPGERIARARFKPCREWKKVMHQTAGTACHHVAIIGTVLSPRPEIAAKLKELSDVWFATNAGALGPTLDELFNYRNFLREQLGVDCNSGYNAFEEGVYPIDCTSENLKALVSDELPDDLDKLLVFRSEIDAMCGFIGRWKLWLLGPNSD